jgi:hypothetical protein
VRVRRPLPGPLPIWAEIVLLPLVNIALAFLTVGIIVRIVGADPLHALALLVVGAFGSPESIGYTLYYATNFIFTGCSTSAARGRPTSAGWAAGSPCWRSTAICRSG